MNHNGWAHLLIPEDTIFYAGVLSKKFPDPVFIIVGRRFALNFWNALPHRYENEYVQNEYNLSSGIRISLLDNKLNVTTSVNDILKGHISKGKVYYDAYYQSFNNYYDYRSWTLSVTYLFGKTKVKGDRKKINFKETQRAN